MPDVILKKDIFRLGERGDVVSVANGYARNYLYPQRLAIPADKGSLKQLETMRAAAAREAVRVRGDAEQQLAALEGQVVRVVVRASLNNQLYGSVTARDIAEKLAALGIEVERNRIQLTTPIRSVGDYDVPVHIYKELSSTLKVEVRAQGREDEPINRSIGLAAELEFAPAPPPEVSEEEGGDEAAAEATESAADAPEATAAAPEAAAEEPAAEATESAADEPGGEVTEPAAEAKEEAAEEAAAEATDAAAEEAAEAATAEEPAAEEASAGAAEPAAEANEGTAEEAAAEAAKADSAEEASGEANEAGDEAAGSEGEEVVK